MEQPTKTSKFDKKAETASLKVFNILHNKNLSDKEKIAAIDAINKGDFEYYRKGVQTAKATQGVVKAPKISTGWVMKEYKTLGDLKEQESFLTTHRKTGRVPILCLVDWDNPRAWMQNVSFFGYIPLRVWYKNYRSKLKIKDIKVRFERDMPRTNDKSTSLSLRTWSWLSCRRWNKFIGIRFFR